MDYEKAYKDALGWMRSIYPTLTGAAKEDAEHYFPEIKESEDERIRKAIESIIRVYGKTQGGWIAGYDMDTLVVHLRDAFAYLEKQKEQKPADEQFPPLEGLDAIKAKYYDDGFKNGFDEGVASVKPAEWSEEDDQLIGFIFDLLNDLVWRKDWAMSKEECLERLKSLRPQSKEELDAIAKREYERGKGDGYWEGYKKAQEDHNNSVTFHYDYPTSPSIKRSCYEGGPCTNPQMDCINCPRKTTGGMLNTASSSGDLTLKAEWKPSEEQMKVFDGLYHNYILDRKDYEVLKSLYNDLNRLM